MGMKSRLETAFGDTLTSWFTSAGLVFCCDFRGRPLSVTDELLFCSRVCEKAKSDYNIQLTEWQAKLSRCLIRADHELFQHISGPTSADPVIPAIATLRAILPQPIQQENDELRDAQAKALVAGITSIERNYVDRVHVRDLIARGGQTHTTWSAEIIRDVIIINNDWEVTDSLNPDFLPTTGPNGETIRKKLSDLPRPAAAERRPSARR